MKIKSILILGFIFNTLVLAQNVEESSYDEKNKSMESFSFSVPVCNKDALISSWKTFIKKQGGKVKGGIVNKANGYGIKFSSTGESWNGHFAYEYNDDKTMLIFTSFQNISGIFINAVASEKEAVFPVLERFRLDIQKTCTLDDLTKAKNYSISLSKEKIHNSDKIISLEKSLHSDRQKIDIRINKKLSEKDQLYLNKIKQRMMANEAELQTLKNRNDNIDQELTAQNSVIQNFQNRMNILDGKAIFEETTVISDKRNTNTNEIQAMQDIEAESNNNTKMSEKRIQEKNIESSSYFDK